MSRDMSMNHLFSVKGKVASKRSDGTAEVAACSAWSMGSPLSARAARAARSSRAASSQPGAGWRWANTSAPAVRVPVLSDTMQLTRPMFSTATARRTRALRRANRNTPTPKKKV